MAKILSAPRRLFVFFLALVVSLLQTVRALPVVGGGRSGYVSSKHRLDHGLLFRFAGKRGGHHLVVEATGRFPYVRLIPLAGAWSVPVPIAAQALPAGSVAGSGSALQHAAVRGLSGPNTQVVKSNCPVLVITPCGGSCGGCGSCGSCSSCASCSSCSCGSSCTSCGTSCTSCGGCAGNCGSCLGFGSSCGSNCLACASCASCNSCSSCTCTSCSSCGNCGSCSSCVG
jgi:hypothetical protein